jgi:hypothetical protein
MAKEIPMRKFMAKGRAWLIGLVLLTGQALAALPDPVAFNWALENGDVARVRAWLDEGLDPEFFGQRIGTGLMSAAWHGNIEMMQLFVERGANPRRVNSHGEQALQLAAWNGHLEAVKWLLEHGAAINRDGDYWGALHYAAFNGHQELARYLIERGADVNARSPNGSTPLMMTAREGREGLAKVLLEAGADTQAKNDWGDTALALAMRYDHYRLGKMISSPEEFEIAVKAPKEDSVAPPRSVPPPAEIEELLAKLRESEAAGQPSEHLRAQLRLRIDELRAQAVTQRVARRPAPLPYRPNRVVITAKRNQFGGERAQITAKSRTTKKAPASVPVKKSAASKGKLPAQTKTPGVDRNALQARIAELMRQIRLAEAQGQPAEALRQELYEAVEAQK